jgi:CheY-like chemotaxis protein
MGVIPALPFLKMKQRGIFMIQVPDSLLIVDDDAANRELMLRRLSKRGFDTSHVDNGRSALEWIASHRVDLVLLDIEMPNMNGLEVLQTLRKNYNPSQLPIIMVTGKASSDDIVSALAAGANDYVTKPVDFSRRSCPNSNSAVAQACRGSSA